MHPSSNPRQEEEVTRLEMAADRILSHISTQYSNEALWSLKAREEVAQIINEETAHDQLVEALRNMYRIAVNRHGHPEMGHSCEVCAKIQQAEDLLKAAGEEA